MFIIEFTTRYGGFVTWGYPKWSYFDRIFHYKPSSYWGATICGNPKNGNPAESLSTSAAGELSVRRNVLVTEVDSSFQAPRYQYNNPPKDRTVFFKFRPKIVLQFFSIFLLEVTIDDKMLCYRPWGLMIPLSYLSGLESQISFLSCPRIDLGNVS